MAYRKRSGRTKPYEVYWNNPFTGKRECLYFKTESEARKEDALKQYQLQFERDKFRPDAQKSDKKKKDKPLTVETAFLAYLKEKKFDKKGLYWQMDGMKVPLAMIGKKPVVSVTSTDLQAVKSRLEQENIKPVTVRGRMKVLRTLLNWCYKRDYIQQVPKFPELPPAIYEHIVPPTEKELKALYEVAPDHIRRVIVLGFMFGMRVGPCEMFKLTWNDVDLDQKLIRVQAAKKNKREPWREVPIREEILPMIQEWYNHDKELKITWLVNYRGKQVQQIRHSWNNALEMANLRHFTPYSLRHAFATNLLAAGVDAGTISKLMGHTSTDMIFMHYQHIMNSQKRQAVTALPIGFADFHVANEK